MQPQALQPHIMVTIEAEMFWMVVDLKLFATGAGVTGSSCNKGKEHRVLTTSTSAGLGIFAT